MTSIYKGWMVAFPAPSMGFTELLISYGVAEYRWPTGRKLVTPVAELQGDGSALFEALAPDAQRRREVRRRPPRRRVERSSRWPS